MPSAMPSTVPRWRRPARILLWVSLTLIGLVVLVLGILPSLVSLESVRQQLVARAEAALQRKVEIGAIHLQIWTGLGLGLDDLTVYNPPGWQQPHLLKVSRVSAKIAGLPLLRGQLAISKFVVSTGDLFLERDPAGRLNVGDLLEAKPEGGQPPAPRTQPNPSPRDPSAGSSLLSSLQVADTSFRHVNVTLLDQTLVPGKTITTTLGDLRGDLRNIALQTPIEFEIAGTLLTDTNRNIQVQGRLGPIPEDGSFDSAPLDAQIRVSDVQLDKLGPYLAAAVSPLQGRLGADINAQGTVASRLSLDTVLTLKDAILQRRAEDGGAIALPPLTLTQHLTFDLANGTVQLMEGRLDFSGLQAHIEGTVHQVISTPQLDLRLATNSFASADLLSLFPTLGSTVPEPVDLRGRIHLQGNLKGTLQDLRSEAQVDLRELSLKSGTFNGGKESGGGIRLENDEAQAVLVTRLVDPHPPQVQLDLRAHRLVFDQQGSAPPEPAPGPMTVPPPKEPSGKTTVPPIALSGKINIAEARLEHVALQQLAVTMSLEQGLLKSQQEFQLYGGSYQGQVQVNLAQPEPDMTLEAKMAQVQLGTLLHEVASLSPGVSGALDTQLTLAGRGLTWPTLSHTLNGGGQVRIGGMQWAASNLLGPLVPVLQSVGELAGFTVPAELAQRSFDTLQAPFRIAQGKVVSDHVQLRGKDIEVLAEAALGFDRSLAANGTLFLLGPLVNALGRRAAFLQDSTGRIRLPFAVQGTLTSPQVVVNQQQFLDMAKQSLGGTIEQRTGEELRRRFGDQPQAQTPNPSPGKPSSRPDPREKPLEPLDRTLRRLLGR